MKKYCGFAFHLGGLCGEGCGCICSGCGLGRLGQGTQGGCFVRGRQECLLAEWKVSFGHPDIRCRVSVCECGYIIHLGILHSPSCVTAREQT